MSVTFKSLPRPASPTPGVFWNKKRLQKIGQFGIELLSLGLEKSIQIGLHHTEQI